MKNKQLINRILDKINYKTHTLSTPICIDNEEYTTIQHNAEETLSFYEWTISKDDYEISLQDLTNRELIKLYQSI